MTTTTLTLPTPTATFTIDGQSVTTTLSIGPRGADGGSAVTSVAGRTGAVTLTADDVGGLGGAALAEASAFATAAQGTNAREWTAETVDQTEAEAGTATTRRAWSAQRVRQAIAAWWQSVSSTTGRSLVTAADAAAARAAIGAASASGAGISIDDGNALTLGADSKPMLTAPDQTAAEAGVATTPGAWSVLRVWQAIKKALGGVTISNTPTTGQVLTATSTSAAAWSAPAGGAPAGSSGDIQYNAAGAFGAAVGLTYNSTTRQIALTGGALTSAGSLWSIAATWNNAAATMGGLTINVTDTASAAASLLMDLQVGGSSKYSVRKDGSVSVTEVRSYNGFGSVLGVYCSWSLLGLSSVTEIGFSAGLDGSTGKDTAIRRSATGQLSIDNGTAGTYRDLRLRNVRTNATTVSGLVAAATAGAGARGFVTDANSATFGAAAVGGGANAMPVWCDGTGWFIG